MTNHKFFILIILFIFQSKISFSQIEARAYTVSTSDSLKNKNTQDQNILEDIAYDQMQSGDYKNSIDSYNKLLKLNPNNNRAIYNIAWIYATNRQPIDAIKYAKEALLLKNITKKEQFYRIIANCYTELDSLDQAIPYYKKALDINPNDILTIYNYGYNRFKKHDFEKSIELLKKSLVPNEKINNRGDIYFYIGTAYSEMKMYPLAVTYLDSAISISDFENYYANKAEALSRSNDNARALLATQEGIRNNPNSSILYFKQHQIKKKLNRIPESEDDLRKAYSLNKQDASILLDMGVLMQDQNRSQEALDLYKKSLQLGGEMPSKIYSNIANIYSNNKLTADSADFYYNQAINIDKNSFELYYNYGNFLNKIKNHAKAEKQFEIANKLQPNHASVMGNYALTLSLQNKDDEAKRLLLKAIQHHPNSFELNLTLARIYFSNDKNYELAAKYATNALSNLVVGKPNTTALSIRANSRMFLHEYRNAIDDYLEIISKFSKDDYAENYDILSNIGYCYLDLEEYDNAESYFLQCLQYHNEIDALLGICIVKYNQNNLKELESYKKKVWKANPKLKDFIKGLESLKSEGYSYTPKVEKQLVEIFQK